jgi:aldehyde:ferredoxin oxidoreductase
VKFAGIVHGERIAARCGLGAVMGSKNLKAISLRGAKKVTVKIPEEFSQLARNSASTLKEVLEPLSKQGTILYVDVGLMFNDMPIKYFQEIEFDGDSLNAKAMEEILVGRNACYSCPLGCGKRVTLQEYKLERIAGPEFQTVAAFGSNLMISDLKKVALINRLCNEHGLDTISCGSTIAFATHLCEQEVLDWGLEWSNPEGVMDLIPLISRREGIGGEIAEGSLRLGERYGVADQVIHVKGLEVPNHDPRAFAGMATVYAAASRGASHLEGDMYSVDMGVESRELGIFSGDRLENEGKGETAAKAQSHRAFFDCVIMCHFAIVPNEKIIELLNLATGMNFNIEDILKIGSRAVTLKRIFNLKCGLKPEDDTLPKPLLKPLPDEVTEDFAPDIDLQMNEYYSYRKWDRDTGWPTDEALKELDIEP